MQNDMAKPKESDAEVGNLDVRVVGAGGGFGGERPVFESSGGDEFVRIDRQPEETFRIRPILRATIWEEKKKGKTSERRDRASQEGMKFQKLSGLNPLRGRTPPSPQTGIKVHHPVLLPI